MGDGLYATYQILEPGPLKDRVRASVIAVADWAIDRAWDPKRRGFIVRYEKTTEGAYHARDGVYGGFIALLGVTTMAAAFEITGDPRYLEAGKEMFRVGVLEGRSGVYEGKQVGQAMEYVPYFLAVWDAYTCALE